MKTTATRDVGGFTFEAELIDSPAASCTLPQDLKCLLSVARAGKVLYLGQEVMPSGHPSLPIPRTLRGWIAGIHFPNPEDRKNRILDVYWLGTSRIMQLKMEMVEGCSYENERGVA